MFRFLLFFRIPNRLQNKKLIFRYCCGISSKNMICFWRKNLPYIVKWHQLACSLFGVSSRECRAAELAKRYVQTRVSGYKIWVYSRITSLSAASVPVIFSSLDELREAIHNSIRRRRKILEGKFFRYFYVACLILLQKMTSSNEYICDNVIWFTFIGHSTTLWPEMD